MPAVARASLSTVEVVPGLVQDFDDARVLYLQGGELVSRDRATGEETAISEPDEIVFGGRLAPTGAIYFSRSDGDPYADLGLRVSRDGVSSTLSWRFDSLEVSGGWALWSLGTDLYLYDLEGGVRTRVSEGAGNIENAVTSDGAAVFWTNTSIPGENWGTYEIVRWQDGVGEQLTESGAEWSTYPRSTDGVHAIYTRLTPCCIYQQYEIRFVGPEGDVVLADWRAYQPRPGSDYLVNGAWAAFNRVDEARRLLLFTRSPEGVETPVLDDSYYGYGDPALVALSPTGEVLYTDGMCLHHATADGASKTIDVPPAWARFTDAWYLVRGGFVFRFDDDGIDDHPCPAPVDGVDAGPPPFEPPPVRRPSVAEPAGCACEAAGAPLVATFPFWTVAVGALCRPRRRRRA